MGAANHTWSRAPKFYWLAMYPLPAQLDLRLRGWDLVSYDDRDDASIHDAIGLIDRETYLQGRWHEGLKSTPEERHRALVIVDVDCSRERAQLLRFGLGDVVAPGISLDELDARALQIVDSLQKVPRVRKIEALTLDLLAREAFVQDQALNLNPREFALIWRLSETLDRPVSKRSLIQDVWRMGFIPETNSIAVHMSRLRRKLDLVGLKRLIETIPSGGYALRSREARRQNGTEHAASRSSFAMQPTHNGISV